MSEGLAVFVVFYVLFSMLFALMWVDFILRGKSFIGFYRNSIKNKNAFGKIYVTIFYLLILPSYMFAILGLYVTVFLQWVYKLGIKDDEEVTE